MKWANEVTLLDGAMGSALRARGVMVPDYRTSVWSALALLEAPAAVTDLHRDYILVGAEVITANNYAVTPKVLAREGLEGRLGELTATACHLAAQARENMDPAVRIAGSLPPLDTSYLSDLVGDYEENLDAYRTIAALLAPQVDIFLCETMTTAAEAHAAVSAAAPYGKPIWVAWTLADPSGLLRGGESLATAVQHLADLPVAAFLVNCCSARAADRGLAALASQGDRPFGAYANPCRRELAEADQRPDHPDWLGAEAYAATAGAWLAAGATIVGGCCGSDPDYIGRLRRLIDRRAAAVTAEGGESGEA